ncbi:hypothetical protein EJ03DRAFT_178274 [Teratosphaeria nubilosa]|uniref:Uncharacterized protein n=1 Tax=Teratosphaeria nubilosa TaxID=161662 RepID=A0A6G1L0M7_9PEZI|nr:hypothetical protein EJ03DRAFT_178274 [Teratosphaeria nubilosa]
MSFAQYCSAWVLSTYTYTYPHDLPTIHCPSPEHALTTIRERAAKMCEFGFSCWQSCWHTVEVMIGQPCAACKSTNTGPDADLDPDTCPDRHNAGTYRRGFADCPQCEEYQKRDMELGAEPACSQHELDAVNGVTRANNVGLNSQRPYNHLTCMAGSLHAPRADWPSGRAFVRWWIGSRCSSPQ